MMPRLIPLESGSTISNVDSMAFVSSSPVPEVSQSLQSSSDNIVYSIAENNSTLAPVFHLMAQQFRLQDHCQILCRRGTLVYCRLRRSCLVWVRIYRLLLHSRLQRILLHPGRSLSVPAITTSIISG
jgi:hypothetical protein